MKKKCASKIYIHNIVVTGGFYFKDVLVFRPTCPEFP